MTVSKLRAIFCPITTIMYFNIVRLDEVQSFWKICDLLSVQDMGGTGFEGNFKVNLLIFSSFFLVQSLG